MECLICRKPQTETFTLRDLFQMRMGESRACQDCYQKFHYIGSQHCKACWKDQVDGICSDCEKWRKKGVEVSHQSIFSYNQAMREYFSTYKFMGDYLLRTVFKDDIRKRLKEYRGYTIVPIPISQKKWRKRKFNQVIGLLDAANVPYKELLKVNARKKQDQSSKTRTERLQTKQFFEISTKDNLPSKILIVDDIYTTGKTLQLARECLEENGARNVKTFSIAR